MKKLVLFLLLLTSKNIARGLPIYMDLSWKNFSTYDLLNKEKKNLIQRRVSNTDYKFNFNLQMLSINKKLKIYLDFSVGLAFRSFPGTEDQIMKSYDKLLLKKGKKSKYNEINKLNEEDTASIFITSVESYEEKNACVVHYKCNNSLKHAEKNINDLFADGKDKTSVYPCSLKGLFLPISGGLSAKIKIQSKIYIKICLHGYINFNLNYYYDFTHLRNLMDKYVNITDKNIINPYWNITSNYDEDLFLFKKRDSDFLKIYNFLKPFGTIIIADSFKATDTGYAFHSFYGGIFNITISCKIYKHLGINFSLFSLEYFLVNDCTHKKGGKLKEQFEEFKNREHVLFLHLPSFEISIF